ncbi:MAG TPA: ABC transporter permease [Steroidobacteraceae bacterium]|nr:ABC transporter permease [Steroidobacteraceae bacterium]
MLNPSERGAQRVLAATGGPAQAAAAAPEVQASLAAICWVGFRTIVIREYGRIMRIWGQTLVPSAVQATLYFVIFGHVVGRRISVPGGLDYPQYIAPGLIMMAIITNSYGNVVSSFFGAKFGKHVEELLVSPLPNWLIIAGYAAGGLVRGALVAVVVGAVSLVFTHGLPVRHIAGIIAAALLTCTAFSLAGFINAMVARNFEQMNIVPAFILTPLTYFGGVFYSISMLPAWAHRISLFNPILYMVSAFRYGFFGIADVDVLLSLALVAGLAVALFVTALVMMNRGVGIRD